MEDKINGYKIFETQFPSHFCIIYWNYKPEMFLPTDRPGPPDGPLEVLETTSSLIEITWKPPKDDGGSGVTNYIIERQQTGQSLWTKLGEVSAEKTSYRDRNVTHGKRYNYRIFAENPEGVSDALDTTDSIMAGMMSKHSYSLCLVKLLHTVYQLKPPFLYCFKPIKPCSW